MSAVAIDHGKALAAQRRALAVTVLALGAFTGIANGALLGPLLVPISAQFGVSPSRTGGLGSVFALAATIAALLGAPHLRRFSPRRLLRLQTPVVATAALICALAPGFGWLVAGRALAGAGGALILATCMSAAGELFADPVRRNRAIGIIVSATTLAIVLGLPIFAQIETHAGWRWAIAFLLLPLALLFAGAGLLPIDTRGEHAGTTRTSGGYRAVVADSRGCWLLVTMALYGVVYYGWLTYFAAYLKAEFGAGAGTLSLLFLASGAAELLANNLAPALLRRVRPATVFAVTAAVWSASLLGTGLIYRTTWSLFGAITVTGACACVLYMAIYVRAIESEPAIRGTVVSLLSASSGLGSAIGASAGGAVLALFGDYVSVYRLLGLVLLATIVTFRRASASPRGSEPTPAASARRRQAAAAGAD